MAGERVGRWGRWEERFAPEAGAARRARLSLEQALRDAGVEARVVNDALLVLGEFVTNALRHARTEFVVSATTKGGVLRIEVFDHDTRPPALMGLDSDSTSGRGLHIVSAIATDWGWHTAEEENGVSGKVVWAELALDATQRPAPA